MLVLLFNYIIVNAQEINLSTIIKDNSGIGIRYASIVFKNTMLGNYADSLGKVKLTFTKVKSDTIVVAAIGYQTKNFHFKDLPKIIMLEEEVETIEIAEIRSKKKKEYKKNIGEIKRRFLKFKNSTMRGNKGIQYAFFLQNTEGTEGLIKNVYFNLDNDKKIKGTKIRVRLYSRNTNKKSPDKDLIDKNIIIEVASSGILKIDLEKYNISFPVEGCFLGLDLLGNGKEEKGDLVYPHILAYYPQESKNIFTEGVWYGFMDNGKWYQNPKIEGIGKDIPYFGMDIVYFKD